MKYLLLTAFILLGLIGVSAQERIIDKAEFDKMMSGNYQALRNTPYRTIEESVMKNSFGSPMKTRNVTERFGAMFRSLYESDSATTSMKTETIFINGKRFVKKQNNPWIEEKFENKTSQNNFETISDETVYKSLGEQTLNDKKAKVYQTVQIRKTVDKEKGNEFQNKNTTTYYFDESGLMFRSEQTSENVFKPKNDPASAIISKETKSIRKVTKTIEIDRNIKIEEPQIG